MRINHAIGTGAKHVQVVISERAGARIKIRQGLGFIRFHSGDRTLQHCLGGLCRSFLRRTLAGRLRRPAGQQQAGRDGNRHETV
jgi:hypothetical protein